MLRSMLLSGCQHRHKKRPDLDRQDNPVFNIEIGGLGGPTYISVDLYAWWAFFHANGGTKLGASGALHTSALTFTPGWRFSPDQGPAGFFQLRPRRGLGPGHAPDDVAHVGRKGGRALRRDGNAYTYSCPSVCVHMSAHMCIRMCVRSCASLETRTTYNGSNDNAHATKTSSNNNAS